MTKRIVIVGDLPVPSDRAGLLRTLSETHPSIEWDWLTCNTPAFNLPDSLFKTLLAHLQNPPKGKTIVVVKLACLNGRERNRLYRYYPNPIIAPDELQTADELANWLLNDEAALLKDPVWEEPIRAAAMLSILAKLIRNKSWNKRKNGHNWTQEADLLSQAPVNRDDGALYGEVCALLGRMSDNILLCKGGKQGKTKLGWCICLEYMPHIKRAILARSLDPLREVPELSDLMIYIDECDNAAVVIDDEIVNETVRFHCRQLR